MYTNNVLKKFKGLNYVWNKQMYRVYTDGGGLMSKDRANLKDFIGERIVVTGIRGRISTGVGRASGPKMLVQFIRIVGEEHDSPIDHVWINAPKNAETIRGAPIGFTAVVTEYLSLDEEDKQVMKLGLKSVRNFRMGRSRENAAKLVMDTVHTGQQNNKNKKST